MGLKTGKTGTTLFSKDRIAHAAKLRNRGRTFEEIADYFGVTVRTVWRWARTEVWAEYCEVTDTRVRPSREIDPDEVHKAFLLYEHLGNIPATARQMKRAYATIVRWMQTPYWK